MDTTTVPLEPIRHLDRALARSAATLTVEDVRCLVAAYYAIQEQRLATAHRLRAAGEHHGVVAWLIKQTRTIEYQIKRALDAWTDVAPAARWAKSVIGIGPVLAAGLAATVRIEDAPTAGHIWRYAGLDPSQEWKRGNPCPWNRDLKRLAFLIGESFVKVSTHEQDYYGHLYAKRKRQEAAANDAGNFAGQAQQKLERFKIRAEETRKWYRRANPYFCAFDCLWLDGRDLRGLPLVERKAILRGLARRQPSRLLYVDHVVGTGVELFRAVCEQDIEGIVAKQMNAPYDPDAPTWVKIKNRNYSQSVGRHERFEKMRAAG